MTEISRMITQMGVGKTIIAVVFFMYFSCYMSYIYNISLNDKRRLQFEWRTKDLRKLQIRIIAEKLNDRDICTVIFFISLPLMFFIFLT